MAEEKATTKISAVKRDDIKTIDDQYILTIVSPEGKERFENIRKGWAELEKLRLQKFLDLGQRLDEKDQIEALIASINLKLAAISKVK